VHDSNFGGVVRVSIYVTHYNGSLIPRLTPRPGNEATTIVWHLTPAYDMTYIYEIPKYMDKMFTNCY